MPFCLTGYDRGRNTSWNGAWGCKPLPARPPKGEGEFLRSSGEKVPINPATLALILVSRSVAKPSIGQLDLCRGLMGLLSPFYCIMAFFELEHSELFRYHQDKERTGEAVDRVRVLKGGGNG